MSVKDLSIKKRALVPKCYYRQVLPTSQKQIAVPRAFKNERFYHLYYLRLPVRIGEGYYQKENYLILTENQKF